jgi:hypothetical protein
MMRPLSLPSNCWLRGGDRLAAGPGRARRQRPPLGRPFTLSSSTPPGTVARSTSTAATSTSEPPARDDPLAALIAQLALRAADTHAPRPRSSEALTLELTRLDRENSATHAAANRDVAPLASRRQDLRDRAIALAIKQTKPAE